ncbi:hypothetical protein F8388_022898 [Cannabis sativa]|uniref:CCHC-type domain-containing protein n=1 Tax=Cannabis sativa TaxID=3483 RepID=A0A7J6FEW9_CANSA|nr:hypothetical protein F8388_022898 [Cannabis sativa]
MAIVEECAEVTVGVDSIDAGAAKLLERDSDLEIEMMELFEDLSLEDIVINKACVGKVMGCKTMPASVVRKILLSVWNLEKNWKMKKFKEGVLGFFFDSEEDCSKVMNRRPWLVNGVLLNLRPFPVEGEVRTSEFEVARFWVEFHGLPTRCLSDNNIPILAKKVGQLVKTDGKSREEVVRRGFLRCWIDVWISHPFPAGFFLKADATPDSWVQYKYEKLSYLCFNCGHLAHSSRDCLYPTAWVTPTIGPAVKMYGPWLKAQRAVRCFSDDHRKKEANPPPVKGTGVVQVADSNGEGGARPSTMHGADTTMQRSMHGSGSTNVRGGATVGEVVINNISPCAPEILNIPARDVLTERPLPDFAQPIGPNEAEVDLIPDIGPSLIQSLEIPHIWTCKSQTPHHFPEPINFKWPTNNPDLQKLYCELIGPDYTDLYKAQPSLISNPPDLSQMIIHLLGTKKRKAHTWYNPIPEVYKDSLFDNNDGASSTNQISPSKVSSTRELGSATFKLGSNGDTEDKAKNKRKARITRSPQGLRRNSGVKTRRSKKLLQDGDGQLQGGRKHAPTFAMRCLAWNCRGLRRPATERAIRGLSRSEKVDVLFLAETKVDEVAMTQLNVRLGFSNVACIPAVGIGGGFCVGWRNGINLRIKNVYSSVFECVYTPLNGLPPWTLFCVYGTPYAREKDSFWQWLSSVIIGCSTPWVIIGDLNVILKAEEKVGGRAFRSFEGAILQNFLMDSGGVDLGFSGPCLT